MNAIAVMRAPTKYETMCATVLVAKWRERGLPDADLLVSLQVHADGALGAIAAEVFAVFGLRVDFDQVKLEARRLLVN